MIPDRELDISISASAKSAGVDALERSLDGVRNALGEAAGMSELTEEQMEDLDQELKEVAGSATAAGGSLSGLGGQAAATQAAVEGLEGSLDDLDDRQSEAFGSEMTRMIKSNRTGMQGLVDDTQKFKRELDDLDQGTMADFFAQMDDGVLNRRASSGDTRNVLSEAINDFVDSDSADHFDFMEDKLGNLENTGVMGNSEAVRRYFNNELIEDRGSRYIDADLADVEDVVPGSHKDSALVKALASDSRFDTAGDVLSSSELPSSSKNKFRNAFTEYYDDAVSGGGNLDSGRLLQSILHDTDVDSGMSLANELGIDGVDVGNEKVQSMADIEGILRAENSKSVQSMWDPSKQGVHMTRGNFSHFIQDLDSFDDMTPGAAREWMEKGLHKQNISDDIINTDEYTQVDAMAETVAKLRRADVDEDLWNEILGDQRTKAKFAGVLRKGSEHGLLDKDMLSQLGVPESEAFAGQEARGINAKRKLDAGAVGLTALAQAHPELAAGIAELEEDEPIMSVLDNFSGRNQAKIRKFIEDYQEEMHKALFPQRLVDDFHDDSINGRADLIDNLRRRNGMSIMQNGRVADAIISSRGGVIMQNQDDSQSLMDAGIPREAVEAQLFQDMLDSDSKADMMRTKESLRAVQQGRAGIGQSLVNTPQFRNEFGRDFEARLISGGMSSDYADDLVREMADEMGSVIGDDSNKINTVRDMMNNETILDNMVSKRITSEKMGSHTDREFLNKFIKSLGEARRARMTKDFPELNALMERGDIDSGKVKGDMRSGAGGGAFVPQANNAAQAVSELRQYRDNKGGSLFARGQLRRIMGGRGMQSSAMNSFVDGIEDVHDTMNKLVPVLDVTSTSIGSFTVKTQGLMNMFASLIALLGPIVALFLGFANALIAATVAMGALVAVGAIGFLNEIEENTAGVNNKMEAAQELMGELSELAGIAFEPLFNAQVGGMDSVSFFVRNLEGAFLLMRDFARMSKNMVETEAFESFFNRVGGALNLGGTGAFEDAMTNTIQTLLPILTDLLVRMINGADEFVNGITRIAKTLTNAWGPAMNLLLEILPELVAYGTAFLWVMGHLFSIVARLLMPLFMLNDAIANLTGKLGLEIDLIRILVSVTGVLVGITYAMATAQMLLNTTFFQTMGLVLKTVGLYALLAAEKLGLASATYYLATAEAIGIAIREQGIRTTIASATVQAYETVVVYGLAAAEWFLNTALYAKLTAMKASIVGSYSLATSYAAASVGALSLSGSLTALKGSIYGVFVAIKTLETMTVVGAVITAVAIALALLFTKTEWGKGVIDSLVESLKNLARILGSVFTGAISKAERKLAALMDMVALFKALTDPEVMATYIEANGGLSGLTKDVMGSPGSSNAGPSSMSELKSTASGGEYGGGSRRSGGTVVNIQGDAYGPSIQDMIEDAVEMVLDKETRDY